MQSEAVAAAREERRRIFRELHDRTIQLLSSVRLRAEVCRREYIRDPKALEKDLLIIEESDLPRYERSPRYYGALATVFPSKDILVYTPAEVDEWRAVPNALTTVALREGRVLYARPR